MINRANTGGNYARRPGRKELLVAGMLLGTLAVATACGGGAPRASATPTPTVLTGQQIIQAEQTVSKSVAAGGHAHLQYEAGILYCPGKRPIYVENPLVFNEAGHILVGYVTHQHHNGRPDTFDTTLFEADNPDYPAYDQPACKLYENDESPFPTGTVRNIEVDIDSHGDITSVTDTDLHKPVIGKSGYNMPVAFQYESQK